MTNAEFTAIFHEHRDAVYGFAYRMTNSADLAEDVAQDCFLALLAQPARFDPEIGALRCFLIGIARNLIFKRWRASGRCDSLDTGGELIIQPIDPAGAETAVLVAQAVGALPPLQREVLILAEYEGFSLKEIAHTVQAELGAVKARLHRGGSPPGRFLPRKILAVPRPKPSRKNPYFARSETTSTASPTRGSCAGGAHLPSPIDAAAQRRQRSWGRLLLTLATHLTEHPCWRNYSDAWKQDLVSAGVIAMLHACSNTTRAPERAFSPI